SSGKGTYSNPADHVDTGTVRATITNARGYTTTYALDRFGAANLIQQPLGRTTSFTRDSNSAIVRSVNPSGHVMKYTWSWPDLTQTLDSMTNRTIHYTYTSHNIATTWGDVDSVVNHWTNLNLDSTHSGGTGWTKYKTLSDGRTCGWTDPGGHQGRCYYTSATGFRNTDSIAYTLGVIRYQYDNLGRPIRTIDQVFDTSQIAYDSIGRLAATIGPLHETTSFAYDGLYLTQVTDAKGQVYKYSPNA